MYTFLFATSFFRSVINMASKLVYLPAVIEGFDCLQVFLNIRYCSYDHAALLSFAFLVSLPYFFLIEFISDDVRKICL